MRIGLYIAVTIGVTSGCLRADIVTTSGDLSVFNSSTASYVANGFNDPDPAPIRLWVEQMNYLLMSDTVLDTGLPDPTKNYGANTLGGKVRILPSGGPTISTGTSVDVFYANFDPLSDTAMGSITFNVPVLGIVALTSSLPATDYLRVSGAPYPGNPAFVARGIEGTDFAQLSADRMTLTFSFAAASPGDQVRIFTEASPVSPIPEPATWGLCVTGLLIAFLARQRVRVRQH